MVDYKLDNEELELLKSLENGEWQSIKNLEQELKKHKQIAKNSMKKDKRINIRLSSKDLELLKTTAIERGLPYQTLVSSILHQYVTGRLVEKNFSRATI